MTPTELSTGSTGGKINLFEVLDRTEPWDQAEAVRLLIEADDAVERHQADGTNPLILEPADAGFGALLARDMPGVRSAAARIAEAARTLTATRSRP